MCSEKQSTGWWTGSMVRGCVTHSLILVITRTPSQTPTLEHRYNRKDNKTEKQSIQTTSLPFSSMEWRPGRSWCTITMTHVNSSVMLFVDGKALSVQNLAKKSAIAFPRSVAMGLIGGKGFVGHLGPISLFRGVPPDHKTLQQLHLASSCSAKQPLSRICLISPDGSDVCARDMYVSTKKKTPEILVTGLSPSSDTNLKTPPSSKATTTTTTPTHENNETSTLQWYFTTSGTTSDSFCVLKPVMPDGRGDELSLVITEAKEEERSEEETGSLQRLQQDESKGIEPEQIEGSVTTHVTRNLSQIIRHWLGGPIVMVFPMLELGERYHLACLNILHAMISSSSSALTSFEKDHGWEVLAYLLNKSKQSLTTATFDCIVDLIAGGQTSSSQSVIEEQLRTKSSRERRRLSILRHDRKTESTRLFLRLRGLNMLVDLLRSASGNRHYVYHSLAEILRLLAELLVSAENQLMWRFCVGLEGTLDLLVAVSNQRRDADSLVTLLEIPTATASTNRSYSEETTLQLREPILQVIRLDLIQRRRPLSELQQSSRLILGK